VEAELVAVASVIGTSISVYMVADAMTDVKLVRRNGRDDLMPVATQRLVTEMARLLLQVLFLVLSIIYAVDRFAFVRDFAFLVVFAVPIVLAGWSIWSFLHRRRQLDPDDD